MFDIFAQTLSAIYGFVPNYAIAIALFTLLAMVITTPFTLKGTRSMIQMQRLQPEMKRLQLQYKDDRQKLNEELMAFYKENSLNPLGGCLPLLLQTPIFLILYRVINGLASPSGGPFEPKYISHSSQLYQDLVGQTEMVSFGVDLAESAAKSLQQGFIHGLPHLLMVAVVAVTSYYQQRQIQGRNPGQEVNPQQQMIMRLMPLMLVFFSFVAPSALVVYFIVSNLYRIGMQYYITRTLYHGEDSLGAQAQRASAEAKKLQQESGGGTDLLPKLRKSKEPAAAEPSTPEPDAKPAGSGSSKSAPPRKPPSAPNRSKKKKKRR